MPALPLENFTEEIRNYLKHDDLDLARRRLLDLAYDTDDHAIIEEAVLWSRKFGAESFSKENWIAEARRLLEDMNRYEVKDSSRNGSLLIEANAISKTYFNGFFSLKPVDVKLKPGEIIGVVGENGNGKTTLLRTIAGQLSASLQPENFSYLKKNEYFYYDLKSQTGFIPQRIPKWYGKLRNNLQFTAALHGITGAENDLMVDFVLERFGLSKYADLKWSQISSGYRTRFEIARLILRRPPVLILDEPLANLDILAQQTLLQDLRYIARSARHPMGVILTSQQLFEVEKIADRVLFISKGTATYNDSENNENIFVFEIETPFSRQDIEKILSEFSPGIRFNGGVYEIETHASDQQCLKKLLDNEIKIHYFRNITTSAKRLF